MAQDANGDQTFYIDFESIEERDGYVCFWALQDYVIRQSAGEMSSKSYNQVDCDQFRFKLLNVTFYKEPMGAGLQTHSDQKPDENWTYLRPNTAGEITLKVVCNYVKLSEEDRQKLLQSLKKNKE